MVDARWVCVNIIGNAGVIIILGAYFLHAFHKISSESTLYYSLNLVGAALIGVSLYFDFNLPNVILEICWSIISLYGIGRNVFRKIRKRKAANAKSSQDSNHSSNKGTEEACEQPGVCPRDEVHTLADDGEEGDHVERTIANV